MVENHHLGTVAGSTGPSTLSLMSRNQFRLRSTRLPCLSFASANPMVCFPPSLALRNSP